MVSNQFFLGLVARGRVARDETECKDAEQFLTFADLPLQFSPLPAVPLGETKVSLSLFDMREATTLTQKLLFYVEYTCPSNSHPVLSFLGSLPSRLMCTLHIRD